MKGFFRSAFGRLFLALFLVLTLTGSVLLYCFSSVVERLQHGSLQHNRIDLATALADNISNYTQPEIEVDRVRQIMQIAKRLNPGVDFTILEENGIIRDEFLLDDKPSRVFVSLDPLEQFAEAMPKEFPIYGEDPFEPRSMVPFVIAPLWLGSKPAYLYITFPKTGLTNTAPGLRYNYLLQGGLLLMIVSALGAALASTALILFLLRRYRYASHIVAHLSHDLKNPLNTVRGYLEALSNKGDDLAPSQRKQFIGVALDQTQNMTELLQDLLQLSDVKRFKRNLVTDPFSMGELIQEILQQYSAEADKRSILLTTAYDPELPEFDGDRKLIQRAISNLVENGIRYTPDGGEVSVKATTFRNVLLITVADTGMGIAKEDLTKVFQRFYRGENAQKKVSQGTGLGLALVKRVIEAHGGRISVESTVNFGTTVECTLPLPNSR